MHRFIDKSGCSKLNASKKTRGTNRTSSQLGRAIEPEESVVFLVKKKNVFLIIPQDTQQCLWRPSGFVLSLILSRAEAQLCKKIKNSIFCFKLTFVKTLFFQWSSNYNNRNNNTNRDRFTYTRTEKLMCVDWQWTKPLWGICRGEHIF